MPEVIQNESPEEMDPPYFATENGESESEEVEEEAPKVVRAAPKYRTRAAKEILEEKDQTLKEYLESLSSGENSIRIHLHRLVPRNWKGHNIAGKTDVYEEPIDEETIKEQWGGGQYQLKIQMPSSDGKWKFVAHKNIKIAGDPIIRSLVGEEDSPANSSPVVSEDAGVAKAALQMVKEMSSRPQGDGGMSAAISIMQRQLETMQNELRRKEERLAQPSTADKLVEKMIDSESTRIEAIRMQHQSEINAIRERNASDLDRIHAMYQTQINTLIESHKREIAGLAQSNMFQLDMLKNSHQMMDEAHKRENNHLNRELTAAKTELERLRGEKVKTPFEMLNEVTKLKDAFQILTPEAEAGEAQPTSAVERILTGALAPLIEGIGSRIAEGPGVPGAAPQRQMTEQEQVEAALPVNQPVKLPDGRVVVRKEDGSIHQVQRKKKPTVEVKGGSNVVLDPKELTIAIRFMENSIGTDPKVFAASVRNMIPVSVQTALARDSKGVDHFLDEVANLEPGSKLSSQTGRDWVREVVKHLF